MFSEIPAEELAAVLDETVSGVLSAAGVHAPPVNALHVARQLSLIVAWDKQQTGRARIVRLAGADYGPEQRTILLQRDPRAERRQWAVAHEVGEATAETVFDRLGLDPFDYPRGRETVANLLANRLLLPTDWFAEAGRTCQWDLFALKNQFSTASHELIARRMLDFDSPAIIVSVFDQGGLKWRKKNIPGFASKIDPVERDCWRLVHETGRPARKESDVLIARAWPIHEPGWKRDILRADLIPADS